MTNHIQKVPHPHKTPFSPRDLRYLKASDLVEDTKKLIKYVPPNCRGIVGVPRSGMMPASLIATLLNLPLYELTPGGPRLLGAGSRSMSLTRQHIGSYFLVEDTTHNGGSMKRARAAMKDEPCIFAAVYSLLKSSADVYAVHLPSPHLLEWNLFNNPLIGGAVIDPRLRGGLAFDFDGIFCQDPSFPHTDEKEKDVIKWILNATPKHLPRLAQVPLVISFRLERHRHHTEAWLRRWGVRVDKLVLHQAESFSERDKAFDVAKHKGQTFKESTCCIFFESDPAQAPIIADVAGKPVIVPDTGRVYLP